ncbi:MAG: hypothetical protein DRO99_00455, partial [Candidatus Aenigmatarchaeota archaeon]
HKDCAAFLRGMDKKKLSDGADLISAAVTLKGKEGAKRSLKIMLREDRIEGLLKRKTLAIWKHFVDDEIKRILGLYKTEKEEYPEKNLTMFRIKSSLNISSVISTILSERNPKKIIVIYKLSSGAWKASLRLQDGRTDLGTLAKKCTKGIGSGGGHRQAAGARVNNWTKFKKRLLESL